MISKYRPAPRGTTIKAIADNATAPVRLPTPDELVERARELDARRHAHGRPDARRRSPAPPLRGRPQQGHAAVGWTYLAESTLLPMMLFAPDPQNAAPPTTGGRGRSFTAISCAGAIHGLDHVIFEDFVEPLVA